MSKNKLKCELCGGDNFRVLHEGDESNCDCVGKCLLVCDSTEDCDGCLIEVKFSLRCLFFGHVWLYSNDGYAWCVRCFKERVKNVRL
jgi:hypothetical protein